MQSDETDDGGATQSKQLFVLCLALLVLVAMAIAYMSQTYANAQNWVNHALTVRENARTVLSGIQDLESGYRGLLLSTKSDYLKDYPGKKRALLDSLTELDEITRDNPSQQFRFMELKKLIASRIALIDRGVGFVRDGNTALATEQSEAGEGEKLSEQIRDLVTALLVEERRLLEDRQEAAAHDRAWLLVLIGTSLFATLALGAIFWRSTAIYVANQNEKTKELLREANKRKETEAALRQAQKLEAVGQLTGGIAHDFNNLLTVIIGNLDTAQRRIANSLDNTSELASKLQRPIGNASEGAKRAAQLTHRLLAFSRKQPLEPRPLDLNQLISGITDMVTRTLGETVEVETVLSGGLWTVWADANQVENALLNLVVNARDAMEESGRLTIETGNAYLDEAYARRFPDVTPGQYVLLSVADTGTGMSDEALENAFQPFFTTKETGKGSGLGLAMVHGFVKQSGGHVRIYSELGHGTTIKIYLPRLKTKGRVVTAPPAKHVTGSALPRALNGEVVMLVEDNESVREYAVAALRELGYRVSEAGDGVSALEVIKSMPRVDLLFTDVVLPRGMTGRELAAKIAKTHPKLPVLYTTGYTPNAIVHHGRLDDGVYLLSKPYTQENLARKVRTVLDEHSVRA